MVSSLLSITCVQRLTGIATETGPAMISPVTSVAFHFQTTNNDNYHITGNLVIVIKPLGYFIVVTMAAACDFVVTQIKKYIFIILFYI